MVDRDDHPVPDVLVVCDGHSKGAALSGPDGRASVADSCRKVQCLRGGLIPGDAAVEGGKALCRVTTGAVVTGELDAKLCEDDTSVAVLPLRFAAEEPEPGRGFFSESAAARLTGDGRSCRFQLKPVPPDAYLLIVSATDGWSCATDLGPIPAEPRNVTPFWHTHSPLEVTVVGKDGKPAHGIPLRVALRGHNGEYDPPTGGHCLMDPPTRVTFERGQPNLTVEDWSTDEKGHVRLMFDPADDSMVVQVRDPEDPDSVMRVVPVSGLRGKKLMIDLREPVSPP